MHKRNSKKAVKASPYPSRERNYFLFDFQSVLRCILHICELCQVNSPVCGWQYVELFASKVGSLIFSYFFLPDMLPSLSSHLFVHYSQNLLDICLEDYGFACYKSSYDPLSLFFLFLTVNAFLCSFSHWGTTQRGTKIWTRCSFGTKLDEYQHNIWSVQKKYNWLGKCSSFHGWLSHSNQHGDLREKVNGITSGEVFNFKIFCSND